LNKTESFSKSESMDENVQPVKVVAKSKAALPKILLKGERKLISPTKETYLTSR